MHFVQQLHLPYTTVDCFTSHIGKHREFPAFFQNTHSTAFPRRGNAFCSHYVGDTCHAGDCTVFPVVIWIRKNWVSASHSDAHQPIRMSVSETKEAVYRPMHGASWSVEQTKTTGINLGMGSANERWHYIVMSSLTGWAHTKEDPSTNRWPTFAEASHAPDTNVLMSGASERLITSPVWPVNDVVCCPVSISHRALQT